MRAKQEIFISEAKKLQDYLVVPNNLLLSLSLSLSRNTGLQPLLLFLNRLRARGQPRNPYRQGTPWSFPRPLTHTLLPTRQRVI